MDYSTEISLNQYSKGGTVYYSLKVTDVMNMDYYYEGSAPTFYLAMSLVNAHIAQHDH